MELGYVPNPPPSLTIFAARLPLQRPPTRGLADVLLDRSGSGEVG
jgi:hypothetical protein